MTQSLAQKAVKGSRQIHAKIIKYCFRIFFNIFVNPDRDVDRLLYWAPPYFTHLFVLILGTYVQECCVPFSYAIRS